MGEEVARDGVERAVLYGSGIVVMTSKHAMWAVTSLAEPRPQRFAVPLLRDPPHAMAVLEPQHTLSGCLEVPISCVNMRGQCLCPALCCATKVDFSHGRVLDDQELVCTRKCKPCQPQTPAMSHWH